MSYKKSELNSVIRAEKISTDSSLDTSHATQFFIARLLPLCNQTKAEFVNILCSSELSVEAQSGKGMTHFASAYPSFKSQSYSSLLIASRL